VASSGPPRGDDGKEQEAWMVGMVPEDIFELTGVSDPRVSPDGLTIAYVVWSVDRDENEYRSAIWLAAADGSTPPRRFTSGSKRDASPRWSPDGRSLTFASNREGEHAQLYAIAVGGGEPRKLTDLKEDVTAPAWSPDGGRLAFTARVPNAASQEDDAARRPPRRFTRLQFKLDDVGWTGDRRQHVFTVAADGSAPPEQLTDGDFEDADPCWSPDGARIAFTSARDESWDRTVARDVYVIRTDGGSLEKLTTSDGTVERPSWSPDGSRIAYLVSPGIFDDPRHGQVAVIDVATRERLVLSEALDRNCLPWPLLREPIWDGDDLLFVVEDHGNMPLYRVPANGSVKPEVVEGADVCLVGYDAAAGVIAHAPTEPTALSELAVGGRRLTDVGAAFAQRLELAEPERFVAFSSDGAEVEAWIVRPVDFVAGERYPTILNVHGGPFAQYGNRFFDEFQIQAGAGYAVLYANPRGSSGYTESWGRAIRGPIVDGPGWGSVDYDDLMAVMDEAVRRFSFVDPERLGVTGGSYGGFMTSWIVGHTDRFRAACSERAVNDFMLEVGTSDTGWMMRGEFGAFWFETPEAHLAMSPITYASDITAPLLIIHSEDDLRCPVGNAEELFTILRLLDKEVELVRFPSEGHELSRSGSPIHRVQRAEIVLDWFDRHLRGG
jgi:dipeptidyl aminopeptidase/acylaminoacyl peptidase